MLATKPLPKYRTGRKAYVLTRAALALLCAVSWIGSARVANAQDSGLRGTTNDSLLDSQSTVKKPKSKVGVKKSRLASQETIQQIERYQPIDLEADSQNTDSASDTSGTLPSGISGEPVTPQAASDNAELIDPSTENPSTDNPNADNLPTGNRIADANRETRAASSAPNNDVLAPEVPEPITRQSSDGSLQAEDVGRVESENERTGSIEGKDITAETDPYSAPGIRAGTFVLRPTFEAGVRYSNETSKAESKLLLRAESDWLRNALNVEAEVNLQKALSKVSSASNTDLSGNGFRFAVDGRVDATADDEITASASFERAREEFDTSSTVNFSERPMVTSLRGTVGYTHDAGLISLGGTLGVTRQTFGDGIDLAGVSIDQDDRDFTNVTGTLRAGYELSPVFTPFVEAEIGRRQFDNKVDVAGIANSATRYALRVGTTIDTGEKLNGELAGGWFVENIDDPSLKNVSGFDLRGTMNWSPVRDTTVALSLGTQVEGARTSGSSTSVVYSSSAEFTRRLRANLEASALLSASFRDFQGNEASLTTLSAEAGATWWFNRYAGIKGSVEHSRTTSQDATRKRSTTGVYVGVILRR